MTRVLPAALLALSALLPACAPTRTGPLPDPATYRPGPGDTVTLPDLGPVGRWMITKTLEPATWLGERTGGRTLREPINVLILDRAAATPEDAADFRNGRDVVRQLARIGLTPADIDTVISTHYDIDHAGRHAAFPHARYVVQRAHHEDAATNPRFAPLRDQWDQPAERLHLVDGDTTLLPGLDLIETGGHVPGHQSVLVRLPQTGPVLLTVDAAPFAAGFTPDPPQGSLPDGDRARPSLHKLLDLAAREQVRLVIFGHDQTQWATLKQLPDHYS